MDCPNQRGASALQSLLVLCMLAMLATVGYLLWQQNVSAPVDARGAGADAAADGAAAQGDGGRRLFVGTVQGDGRGVVDQGSADVDPGGGVKIQLSRVADPSVPRLNDSDSLFRAALLEQDLTGTLVDWLIDDELIRRFVILVDNMAVGSLPRKHSLIKPLPSAFVADEREQTYWLGAVNYQRYQPYVALFDLLETEQILRLYQRYYPLMQQAYAELGYPRNAFHHRVLAALEHILDAPDVLPAIELQRPSVMFKFADPAFEASSDVHKQVLRIGPANARRLKQVVSTLQNELLRMDYR